MTKFEQYRGNKRWKVEHTSHGSVIVAAPDEDAALYAAAQAWRCKWTDCAFYMWATATMM